VHAYLIVPREAEQRRRGPRIAWWVGGAAALAVLAVVAVVGIRHLPASHRVVSPVPVNPAADATGQLVLGVMLFKPLGDPGDNAWMREALRDGLNTQLADLSRVKVYSKEFLDFLITRQGLTEIEAATRLGIRKMLSGSFAVDQGRLRIETHVVDVETGVLDSSYTTTGRAADFTQLQDEMVQEVISRLNLPVTPEEQRRLAARRNTNMEALRLLLDAERGRGEAPPPREPQAPNSALPRWLALLEPLGPAPARADAPPAARQEILAALEQYRRATEARELPALAAVYVDFSPEQRAAQQRYFENVRDLKVTIENVDIAVVGEEAVVSYTRTDDFADVRTGRPMHVSVRLTKVLRQQDGSWKITGGK
jgi:TolB-like protein/ketosteroid isomerase-like protein